MSCLIPSFLRIDVQPIGQYERPIFRSDERAPRATPANLSSALAWPVEAFIPERFTFPAKRGQSVDCRFSIAAGCV